MPEKRQLTLRQMTSGQTGTIVQMLGGHGLVRRLAAMDIRPGKKITKMSSMPFRGPVAIEVDNSQVAIGFGMARKIIVEVDISRRT